MNAKSAGARFSFSTVERFDEHIASEIRGYDILDSIIVGMADAIIQDKSQVYDLGCSTGRLLNRLAADIAEESDPSRVRHVNFVGIEPNANFERYHAKAHTSVTFSQQSVTPETEFRNASLILSVFTLQFIPIHQRAKIISNIYDGLNAGGALVLGEKVLASDSAIERLINDRHIDFKREHSTAEDVLDKDRRLRSIMHPLTLETNLAMLSGAGFTRFESIWRVNNFVAILAIK